MPGSHGSSGIPPCHAGVTVPLLSDTQQLREPLASLEIRLDQKTRPQHKDVGKATCVEPRAATAHTALVPPNLPFVQGRHQPGGMEGRGVPIWPREASLLALEMKWVPRGWERGLTSLDT